MQFECRRCRRLVYSDVWVWDKPHAGPGIIAPDGFRHDLLIYTTPSGRAFTLGAGSVWQRHDFPECRP